MGFSAEGFENVKEKDHGSDGQTWDEIFVWYNASGDNTNSKSGNGAGGRKR